MAKKSSTPDLFETLRASGLRKRVARAIADAAEKAPGRKPPKAVDRTVRDLRKLVGDLEDRVTGSGKRKEAARKAAATRKRKAAKRSAAAKKAAKTRAKTKA
jgi:hypothetical protein